MRFTAAELATQVGGRLVGPDVIVDGATIDSRTARRGQLFVPLLAERDGHDFVTAALDAGCSAYLTSREPQGGTAIAVDDTGAALMQLGAAARRRVEGGVTGITGSVGKTTTKDILRRCLASTFRTAASERSFNNELGLPLTLLNAPDDAQRVVLEMGARGVGHIARLVQVARPDVGIVTSVAMAHVEQLGDLDGVARAKGELVAGLPASGVAVLNVDDARVAAMAGISPCPVLGYGVARSAEVRAAEVVLDDDLRPRFRLVTPWGSAAARLSLHGVQQVPNSLAAAAAALWSGVPLEAVVASLAEVDGSPLRMELRRPATGPALLVDCYNANPASTEAGLRSLAALPAARRLALLGLMAELGASTVPEHRRLAALAADLGIELVGYRTGLYGADKVGSVDDAVAFIRSVGPGDAVLIKGSRVAQLEDVVQAYVERTGQSAEA